jgi:AcrR family transcriptional regulator
MEDIARRAGVGVGTLYRRYPTRSDLMAAAFETKMHAYAEAARQALAAPPRTCRCSKERAGGITPPLLVRKPCTG